QPVFTAELRQKNGVTELADGWVRMEKAYHALNTGKDMALRGRLRLGPGRDYAWPVRFRDHSRGGLMHYGLMLSRNGDLRLHRRVQTGSRTTADDMTLQQARHPGGFAEGAEFDLEITALGDRLQVKINGETLVDVNDTFHQGTRTEFGSDTAVIEFQNLEWRALPAP
ncbi:MAG TPA: hypothetical protein PK490_23560, partial [Prosthecobacter sp.]|nr:hypothetical protein [Prosthecobacter sp.]